MAFVAVTTVLPSPRYMIAVELFWTVSASREAFAARTCASVTLALAPNNHKI